MMNEIEREELLALLRELLAILEGQKEQNWSRGVKAAIEQLVDNNGSVCLAGSQNARSIYNSMILGGRGFAEYFIWHDNEDERIQANKRLDELRERIWKIFSA